MISIFQYGLRPYSDVLDGKAITRLGCDSYPIAVGETEHDKMTGTDLADFVRQVAPESFDRFFSIQQNLDDSIRRPDDFDERDPFVVVASSRNSVPCFLLCAKDA